MSWMLLIPLILIIIFIVLLKIISQKNSDDNLQYRKLDVLFTPAERSFLGVLKIAVNERTEVFGKVRVADVITPVKGQERSKWQKAFNKISSKHFDFILCNKNDLVPICAIELNDKSHNSKKRKKRDEFLTSACQSAGLPLIQIPAKASYTVADIKEALSQCLPTTELDVNSETPVDIISDNSDVNKLCTKCSSPMAVKVAKKGKNIGKEFWACSTFPKCRYIEAKE